MQKLLKELGNAADDNERTLADLVNNVTSSDELSQRLRYEPESKRIRSDDDLGKQHSKFSDELRRPSIAAVSAYDRSTALGTQSSEANVFARKASGFVTEDSHGSKASDGAKAALIRQQLSEVRSLLAQKE